MLDIEAFLQVAFPPPDNDRAWLGDVDAGPTYVAANAHSEEIILYTTVGQAYFNAVLAPLANLTPPDADDLLRAHFHADSSWSITHCSGGGEPDRIYLAPALDSPGCNSLVGGEQLVFRRSFTGVDKERVRTEVSQRLEHALEVYWVEEASAYCRLNEEGDVEPIIRVINLGTRTGKSWDTVVTIKAYELHRYMAVTEMALVTKFDFTRYRRNSFSGWHDPVRNTVRQNNLFYNSGVQSEGSFSNGVHVLRPKITKEQMIEASRRKWSPAGKEYATFIAHDWKNKRIYEISCSPDALASYFEPESDLPFQVTPAFFRPDVLQRYKADPEKYTLEHRSISSRGGWYLKTYDVNDAGQVHTYLCYLADLPYSEQLYWKAFNERPKGGLSARAIKTDFEGDFDVTFDPLQTIKHEVKRLNEWGPDWWIKRGETLISTVHYPLTSSPEEWANALMALDQLLVEGLALKPIRKKLDALGMSYDANWQSLRLLQEHAAATGMDAPDAEESVRPLRELHHLRTKVKGHPSETEKHALIKAARAEHGSLAAHFKHLAAECQEAFDGIVERLGG